MTQVFINGRFLGQPVTGVQRFAREVLRHMDQLLQKSISGAQLEVTLLVPPGTSRSLPLDTIGVREVGTSRGQLWEQLELPRWCGRHLLLNLCNTAPLAAPNMMVTIYDASVFAVPESYSRPFRLWYRTLIPAIGRRSRRVVTASQFSKLELERRARIPRQAIVVIPGSGEHILDIPADEAILQRLGLAPGRYILAVNTLSPHKNVAGLARAAELLNHPDIPVVLAGGSNPRIFQSRSGQLPGSRLRSTGYLSDGELRALYQGAACFAYPSFYEGFGLPPLEAMACGCPVVVSRAASLAEVCGDAALYCDPADPGDIARTVDRVLADSELQQHLRRLGRERAAQFSWRRAASTMIDLVTELGE